MDRRKVVQRKQTNGTPKKYDNQSNHNTKAEHTVDLPKTQNNTNKLDRIISRRFCIVCLCSLLIFVIIYSNKPQQVAKHRSERPRLFPPNPQRTDTKVIPSYTALHIFKNAAVCSDSEICSRVGRQMYVDEKTGSFHKPGTIIKPGQLCKTLQYISDHGGNSLYEGELLQKFADDLKDMGSIITKQDLENYEVLWNDSIPVDINGDTMFVVPPPASGILLSYIFNILKNYKFQPEDLSSVNSTIITYHRIIEAFKHTYGKRSLIGDPRFVDVDDLIQNLTSPKYGEQIRQTIDDYSTKSTPQDYGGQFFIKDSHGTAHISLLGANGDAVSVTSSINFYYGAALTGRRTGIIVNSGMDDFSSPGLKNYFGLPGSARNYIQPQKRALSSMSPTIIVGKDGNVKLIVGAAGGTKITTAVAMVIMKYLWFGSDIKEAVDTPRLHHQLIPMAIQYEFGNLEDVLIGLEDRGHSIKRYRERGSIVCGIAQNNTGIYANADFRKGGDVVGY